MSTQPFSEMTYWSGLSLKRLGNNDETEQLFRRMLEYASDLESREAKIEYFATSLPNLLLFEESLEKAHSNRVKLLRGCALMGLGELPEARRLFEQVLRSEPHCTCAVDVLAHGEEEMSISRLA